MKDFLDDLKDYLFDSKLKTIFIVVMAVLGIYFNFFMPDYPDPPTEYEIGYDDGYVTGEEDALSEHYQEIYDEGYEEGYEAALLKIKEGLLDDYKYVGD